MIYAGGKAQLGKHIAEAIYQDVSRCFGRSPAVIEPFMGGGNVTSELARCGFYVAASDDNLSMVLLLKSLLANDTSVLDSTSEDEYRALRNSPDSARKGLVGSSGSWGGKWFAGYARNKRNQDYVKQSGNALLRQASVMRGRVSVIHCDYRDWTFAEGFIIYCDPPYQGTSSNYQTKQFDSVGFWDWCTHMAKRNRVYVSEYSNPRNWDVVMHRGKYLRMKREGTAEERLLVKGAL